MHEHLTYIHAYIDAQYPKLNYKKNKHEKSDLVFGRVHIELLPSLFDFPSQLFASFIRQILRENKRLHSYIQTLQESLSSKGKVLARINIMVISIYMYVLRNI